MRRNRRYSDHDKHFGPYITYAAPSAHWKPSGIIVDSGDSDEHPGCHLTLQLRGHTLILELPSIVTPLRRWVPTGQYAWAKSPNDGYWDSHSREYGFRLSDGFLQVFLGPQTGDSTTTKDWCKHLPWTQWRFVRFSLYGLDGSHYWTQPKLRDHMRQTEAEASCPKASFEIIDFDGERIVATTHIEEREWLFGEGWFKWLSLFRAPMIRRSLDIRFSKEVGPEKGSWKGGTLGHGIDMLPGELHEAAFIRYCQQDHRSKYRPFRVTYVGKTA